jgi:hypothetical protein
MSEREGSPEGELDAVMADVERVAPLLRAMTGRGEGGEDATHSEALLHALKPYLSPTRREAADYLLRLWRLGALIRNMTGEG